MVAIAAATMMAPGAAALSASCEWGENEDEIVLTGDDDERTRTVVGYKPNEKVSILTRDIVAPLEYGFPCGPAPGGWDFVQGTYGALDDRFRVDGKGLAKPFQNPLAPSIDVIVIGSGGDDELRGHAGFDDFTGGAGEDLLQAGGGHDLITADDGGKDEVKAGPGADDILADDGVRDTIDCGSGFDFVNRDDQDRVTGCEIRE